MLVLTVSLVDADETRRVLAKADGISFVERRSWLLWVVFTVTGSPDGLKELRIALAHLDKERLIQNAW